MRDTVFLIVYLFLSIFVLSECWEKEYSLTASTNQQIRDVVKLVQHDKFESILDPILITRVSGTRGNLKVREYISKFMKDLGWVVEHDTFMDNTPYGQTNFSNIIATLNPKAEKRLLLACHYDSKLNRENTLVVATDSAVPCSMMMALATDLKPLLEKINTSDSKTTLQFVFFDGEEAFVQWSSTDSIYGARHLAQKWAANTKDGGKTSQLNSIEAFVLLDLIGAPNPTFYNQFQETSQLHNRLVTLEKKLHNLKLLKKHRLPNQYFRADIMTAGIEDDHIPFYKRGVPILHIIAVPFPKVWHLESDNKKNLDFDVIENLNKIMYLFVVEYLHLLNDSTA